MSDFEKLEEITAAFTKALIHNKFDDPKQYIELAKRLALLIDMEILWNASQEETRRLMAAWGPVLN